MSTEQRRDLGRLRRHSAELNRMLADGSFGHLAPRRRRRLLSRLRRLCEGLADAVSEATLRHILAAAAVLVLGVTACAQTTTPVGDTSVDTAHDTSGDVLFDPDADPPYDIPADTAWDTPPDTAPDTAPDTPADTGFDTIADTGFDTGVDTGVDTGFDTGLDTSVDTIADTSTDPGSGIRFAGSRTPPGLAGTYSYALLPALADLDGDGDLDLMASYYYYYSGSGLRYWQNTGTATSPMFGSSTLNPFGIATDRDINAPALADLDGDGDPDLLVAAGGWSSGRQFEYFQNTGSATAPAFASPVPNPFGLSAPTTSIEPITLVDIDDDGDLDLFAGGSWSGTLYYYRNTGSATAPAFAAPTLNPSGFSPGSYLSAPAFADLDDDGDQDLMVGTYMYSYSSYGPAFRYYQNTGTASTAAFASPLDNPFGLVPGGWYHIFPAFGDLDDDGDQDIIAGADYTSSFYYYENITP